MLRKHAWGNTELRDLLTELEVNCRDLSQWTREWCKPRVNLLRPHVEVDADGAYIGPHRADAVGADRNRADCDHRVAIGLYDVTDAQLLFRAGRGRLPEHRPTCRN